jgi:hypothetical protein
MISTGSAAWLALCRGVCEIHFLGFGEQLGEEVLIGLAELAEVVPTPRNVGPDVEDHNALIERMARGVLLDGAHDAADELYEGAQIRENTPDHRDPEVAMIEALAEHAGLNDRIELVILKLLKNALVSLRLTGMNIIGTEPPRAKCFRDLDAVVQV